MTTRCRGWVDTGHPEARFESRPETGAAICCPNRQRPPGVFMRRHKQRVIKIERTVIIAGNMPNRPGRDVSAY